MVRKKRGYSPVFLMVMAPLVSSAPSCVVTTYPSICKLLIFKIEKRITSHSSVTSAGSFISESLKQCNDTMHEQRFSSGPDDVAFGALFQLDFQRHHGGVRLPCERRSLLHQHRRQSLRRGVRRCRRPGGSRSAFPRPDPRPPRFYSPLPLTPRTSESVWSGAARRSRRCRSGGSRTTSWRAAERRTAVSATRPASTSPTNPSPAPPSRAPSGTTWPVASCECV